MGKPVIFEMEWISSPPYTAFSPNSVHTQTQTFVLSKTTFSCSSVSGMISAAPLQPEPLTRLFIFAHFKFPPKLKRPVCAWPVKTKKVRQYQQIVIYISIKTIRPREKGAAEEVQGFFSALKILLMWLQAACQPNLIWIYIQRKCLV